MATQQLTWTKPFHGAQHLNAADRPWQITISDYGRFVDAKVFNFESETAFTPVKEMTFFKTGRLDKSCNNQSFVEADEPVTAAQKWAERSFRERHSIQFSAKSWR